MQKQITRISPLQTAKVIGVVQFFAFIPFLLLMMIPMIFTRNEKQPFMGLILLVVMPLFYLIFGFLFTLFGSWVYNHVAKRLGGIEITSKDIVSIESIAALGAGDSNK